jgi:hypothetical protein
VVAFRAMPKSSSRTPTQKPKASKARIRVALGKAKELARREKDLETCLSVEHKVALAAALADDYAALMAEYPDVFPAPPVAPGELRAQAEELREAQAAAERAEEASEEATRKLGVALSELTRSPGRPQKPS